MRFRPTVSSSAPDVYSASEIKVKTNTEKWPFLQPKKLVTYVKSHWIHAPSTESFHQILISHFLLTTSILDSSSPVLSPPVALLLFLCSYLGQSPPPPSSLLLSLPVGVIHSSLCVWCLLHSAGPGIISPQPPRPSATAKGEPGTLTAKAG